MNVTLLHEDIECDKEESQAYLGDISKLTIPEVSLPLKAKETISAFILLRHLRTNNVFKPLEGDLFQAIEDGLVKGEGGYALSINGCLPEKGKLEVTEYLRDFMEKYGQQMVDNSNNKRHLEYTLGHEIACAMEGEYFISFADWCLDGPLPRTLVLYVDADANLGMVYF